MASVCRQLALAIALGLTLHSTTAHAAPVSALDVSFLNSNLTFGGPGFLHDGYDVYFLDIHGVDCFGEFIDTIFTASGGTLAQTTPVFDAGNTLIRTDYLYQGGTFTVDFRSAGFQAEGTFTAPIVSLVVRAEEPLLPDPTGGGPVSGVLVDYVLAPGAFDAAFASQLGIPTHTSGSELASSFMRLLSGDHSAPELEANDGGTSIIVAPAAVPEPALNVLFGLGLAAAAVRARRRA